MRLSLLVSVVTLCACGPRRDAARAPDKTEDAGVVHVVVADASAAPATSSVVSTGDAPLRNVPSLAVKWTAPSKTYPHAALAMAGPRAVVVAFDAKGEAMTARDAKDGTLVWTVAAPPNVAWYELAVTKSHALGIDLDGAITAVRLADGGTAWSQKDLHGPFVGRDGSGLSVTAKGCGTQLVDPSHGRRFPTVFPGHLVRYRPMRGPDGNYEDNGHQRCVAALHLLGQRGASPIAVVEDAQLHGAKLGAIDTAAQNPTFRWSVPFPSPHVFVARIEERGAVVWTEESDLAVVRVDFVTGNVAWKRSLPRREHCTEPRLQVRFVDDMLVVQSCNTVMRLDPKSGGPLWTRDVGDAIAALEGETMAKGDHEPLAERGGRPLAIQWLDRATGAPKARVVVPDAAHDVALARDGALFLERRQTGTGEMGMIGLDGKERWRHGPGLFGYTPVGRFVVPGWVRTPQRHDHVVIDPRSGEIVGVAPSTNQVVGSVPEGATAPELLIASGSDAVTAFVLPPKP